MRQDAGHQVFPGL